AGDRLAGARELQQVGGRHRDGGRAVRVGVLRVSGEAALPASVERRAAVRIDERAEGPLAGYGARRGYPLAAGEVLPGGRQGEHVVRPAASPARVVRVELLAEQAVDRVEIQVVVEVDAAPEIRR